MTCRCRSFTEACLSPATPEFALAPHHISFVATLLGMFARQESSLPSPLHLRGHLDDLPGRCGNAPSARHQSLGDPMDQEPQEQRAASLSNIGDDVFILRVPVPV